MKIFFLQIMGRGRVAPHPTPHNNKTTGGVYQLFQAYLFNCQIAKVFVLGKYGFSP